MLRCFRDSYADICAFGKGYFAGSYSCSFSSSTDLPESCLKSPRMYFLDSVNSLLLLPPITRPRRNQTARDQGRVNHERSQPGNYLVSEVRSVNLKPFK